MNLELNSLCKLGLPLIIMPAPHPSSRNNVIMFLLLDENRQLPCTIHHLNPLFLLSSLFFRNQGAVIPGVLPEALLNYHNYLEWVEQQSKSRYIVVHEDETSFKEASERAWTCVLMQAIKVILSIIFITNEEEFLNLYSVGSCYSAITFEERFMSRRFSEVP